MPPLMSTALCHKLQKLNSIGIMFFHFVELRQRELDRERQKREWEMKERQAEEQRLADEERMRRQQEEMQLRMHHQEEEMRRRQQENTLFMQVIFRIGT